MGKSVLRDKQGNVSHVKCCHKTFLSNRDDKTFRSHTITQKDIQTHYGDDDRHVLRAELLLLVNQEYDLNKMKFDIMRSCEYFKDDVLTGEE